MCYCTPAIRCICCGRPDCHPKQNVTHIEDHKPHLTVNCGETVHVIPVSLIEAVIAGKKDFTQIDDWEDLLKTILRDWINSV
jgi:hypothetical protein